MLYYYRKSDLFGVLYRAMHRIIALSFLTRPTIKSLRLYFALKILFFLVSYVSDIIAIPSN
jgi:hypothetical protein